MILKRCWFLLVVLTISVSILFDGSASSVNAVEFEPAGSDIQGEDVEISESYQDESMVVIQEILEKGQPAYGPGDAEQQARIYIGNNGYFEGWNDGKKVFFSIGTAFFDSEDPSYDDSFITKRSLKTMQASLEAKARIIEFIRTEMSALDRASTPGTDLNAMFKAQINAGKKKMEAQQLIVANLLAQLDESEAEELKGVTASDRANSLMDAAIKKLDAEYSTENIEEKKRAKFEKAKKRYQEALKEQKELEKQINANAGTVTETLSSSVESVAKMPLFGAVTVAQFESWDEKSEQYKVSLVVMWSSKMEALSRAIAEGKTIKAPPGNISLREWLNQQNWSTSTGGRRFKDEKGTPYFIGIAASAVGTSSSSEKQARGISELMAKKEVVMAVFSDVESRKRAEQVMETRNGGMGAKDSSRAAESFASDIKQNVENRQISGLQRLYVEKLVHPISNQKIVVTIYGISADAASQALQMQESSYLARILDVKQQQKVKGQTDAYRSKVESAKRDTRTYQKSKSETAQSIDNKITGQRNRSQKTGSNNTSSQQSQPENTSHAGAQSGTFQGGGNDSLDW